MPITKFEKIRTDDQNANRIQDKIEKFSSQFPDKAIIDGLALTSITLTAGSVNEINHQLGREIQGWIITGQNAQSDIWDSQSGNPRRERTLRLNASATVTVNLWVF